MIQVSVLLPVVFDHETRWLRSSHEVKWAQSDNKEECTKKKKKKTNKWPKLHQENQQIKKNPAHLENTSTLDSKKQKQISQEDEVQQSVAWQLWVNQNLCILMHAVVTQFLPFGNTDKLHV